MATKNRSNKRHTKKQLIQRLEKTFDIKSLDYEKRLKPVKGKSLFVGVGIASLIYGAGFLLGFYALNNQTINNQMFVKMTWYLIVPATMAGMVVWMLIRNKLEFQLREELKIYIKKKEGEKGLLWRFSPIFSVLAPNDSTSKLVCQQSRDGKQDEIAPDDYTKSIQQLHQLLIKGDKHSLPEEALIEIESNFSNK